MSRRRPYGGSSRDTIAVGHAHALDRSRPHRDRRRGYCLSKRHLDAIHAHRGGYPRGRALDHGRAHSNDAAGITPPSHVPFGKKATHVGLGLGQFLPGDPPNAAHPRGTIVALGGCDLPGELRDGSAESGWQAAIVTIDLATLTEIECTPYQTSTTSHTTILARGGTGLLIAVEDDDAIVVIDFDAAHKVRARHRVATPRGHDLSLRGLAAIGDTVILIAHDNDFAGHTPVIGIVLDNDGRIIAKHICPGGLFAPAPPAAIESWRHRALLTELRDDQQRVVACAFGLDAKAATQSARFSVDSSLIVRDGTLLLETRAEGDGSNTVRRLGDDLRPAGPALDPKLADVFLPQCTGITGTAMWQSEMLGGLLVTRTVSCCGDPEPAGLWVCDPAAKAEPELSDAAPIPLGVP